MDLFSKIFSRKDGIISNIVDTVIPGSGKKLDRSHDKLNYTIPPYGEVIGPLLEKWIISLGKMP